MFDLFTHTLISKRKSSTSQLVLRTVRMVHDFHRLCSLVRLLVRLMSHLMSIKIVICGLQVYIKVRGVDTAYYLVHLFLENVAGRNFCAFHVFTLFLNHFCKRKSMQEFFLLKYFIQIFLHFDCSI